MIAGEIVVRGDRNVGDFLGAAVEGSFRHAKPSRMQAFLVFFKSASESFVNNWKGTQNSCYFISVKPDGTF